MYVISSAISDNEISFASTDLGSKLNRELSGFLQEKKKKINNKKYFVLILV